MRVVLDTNVVVSALLFEHGSLAWLRAAWMEGRCRPLVSQPTVAELVRVLAYHKFRLAAEEQEELLGDSLPFVEITRVEGRSPEAPVCRDADDQKFFELAFAGRADVIVTGDDELLRLAGSCSVRILSPAAARALLGS